MEVGDEDDSVVPLTGGRIASLYYLRHQTLTVFTRGLRRNMGPKDVRGRLKINVQIGY